MMFQELYSLLTESDAPRSYSCLMLDLGFLQNKVRKIQEKICPCEVYDLEKGHGLENAAHCTILYGIHEEVPSKVLPLLDLKPVKFRISGMSLFENEKYDVLKFDVKSADLNALNKKCRKLLEYTSNYPDYHAHISVGYLMSGTGRKYTKLGRSLVGKEFTSNKFVFSNPRSEKVWINV